MVDISFFNIIISLNIILFYIIIGVVANILILIKNNKCFIQDVESYIELLYTLGVFMFIILSIMLVIDYNKNLAISLYVVILYTLYINIRVLLKCMNYIKLKEYLNK